MLRKGRTREQASAQFAGEWDEGGTGNAFSTANQRFAPSKKPFLPYSGGPTRSGGLKERGQCEALHSPETPGTLSAWPVRKSGGPTQSGGLKGRGQCEALHSPETPGALSAWPVRKSGGPTQSGGLKGRGQCEALHSPETPGTLSAWPVRRRMSPKMIDNERAEALSNSLRDFFEKLRRPAASSETTGRFFRFISAFPQAAAWLRLLPRSFAAALFFRPQSPCGTRRFLRKNRRPRRDSAGTGCAWPRPRPLF